MSDFDLIVIGGGPGGYVAAIRASQLGMRVGVVEQRKALGGTCLNVGCIPSKALLAASEAFHEAGHGLGAFGVRVSGVALDLPAMLAHKDRVVKQNTDGVGYLFRKNKIEHLHGHGALLGRGQVQVTPAGGGEARVVTARSIVIATGSDIAGLPFLTIDETRVVSSTGALSLSRVPGHLVVIGGGYIGLEMGAVWSRLGAKVTVVEFLDRILPGMDHEISAEALKILKRQGLEFRLSTKVTGAETGGDQVTLTVEPAAGGEPQQIAGDVVLVAIGRRPYTEGLGLEAAGVATDRRGFIQIDSQFRTGIDGVYAIGDCVPGPMLAHKAEDEGTAVAEILAGQHPHIDYGLIPGIVYTHPEIAQIGMTEQQLKEAGTAYRVGKFPYLANGRARSINDTDGFVKLLADARTDRLLGAHIIGRDAGSLIHELAVGMEFGASAEDIARTSHGHPTLNEVVREAALAVDGRALHM